MTEHDEQFLPERVDEQIDSMEHSARREPEFQFVQDLRIVSQDHTEMLDRVWKRLREHMEEAQLPSIAAQAQKKRIHAMIQRQPVQQLKPRKRFISWTTLIAAIFLTLFVAASSIVVFQYAHTQSSPNGTFGGSGQSHPTKKPTSTPAATPTPLPAKVCQVGDLGWASVCTTKQATTIDQTHKIQTTSIHMYAGYADSNRITLAYSIQRTKSTINKMLIPTLIVSPQTGVELSPLGGAGGANPDQTTLQDYGLASFPLLSVADNITVLHIHVKMSLDMGINSEYTEAIPGQTSFDFYLPFHRGRSVTINQTQMVNGQPMTLDHVNVSQTETIIYIRTQIPDLQTGFIDAAQDAAFDLSIGNWKTDNNTAPLNDTWSTNDNKHQPILGYKLVLNYPVFNKKGAWTLLIHHEEIPSALNDIVFHFRA